MQGVAAWLVARPLNTILALAATISLAWLSFLSGVVLVFAVLQLGVRTAVLYAAAAGAITTVIALLVGIPVAGVLVGGVTIWLPALALAVLLQTTRSLTLTLQLAFIGAVIAVVGFFIVVGDPVQFWQSLLLEVVEVWRQLGMVDQANMLETELAVISGQMTIVAVLTFWTVYVANCVLGYWLYRQQPDVKHPYGRFRSLNFGRVIALATALASVGAYLSSALWLQNIAFIMFAMFWLQGLAIVHWSHGQGFMPVLGVIAVYVLMPFLNVILLMGLAVTGYIDAWFGFRRLRTA